MKTIRPKEQELLDILNRGGIHSTKKLAEEMDLSQHRVRMIVKKIREKYLDGVGENYIYVTHDGYTVEDTKENMVYESSLRMKIGFGVLANGSYVFKRTKLLAPSDFNGITIKYKPFISQKLIGGR